MSHTSTLMDGFDSQVRQFALWQLQAHLKLAARRSVEPARAG